ncbi:MAG TPA: prolyl oligopeptidase family serine peptidase [Terriglobales bacterium]|nr:prolyl oligopeptidase family serine peptidase [Terriglobales bacterium]
MRLRILAVSLASLALAVTLGAQNAPKRALTVPDVMAWKSVAGTALSNDGAWLAYRETSLEGDGRVTFRQTRAETAYTFSLGEAPTGAAAGGGRGGRGGGAGANLAFSSDGRFGAFLADPSHAEGERLKRQHKPIESHAAIVNLGTGVKADFARVRRFAFSGDNPAWIAFQKLPPAPPGAGAAPAAAGGRGGRGGASADANAPEADPRGSDLILHNLASGEEINIGNVGEFAFDKQGRYLAYTISAEDRSGNGVDLRNLETGASRALDSDDHAIYRGLSWNDAGTALAVLKGTDDKASLDKRYSLLGFTGLANAAATKTVFNPADDAGFPAGMTLSPNRDPSWSDDDAALFFGIHRMKPAVKDPAGTSEDASDSVDLIIWNYQDPRLQSQQIVEEAQDRNYSYLSEYRLADKTFHRLADDTVRTVALAPHQRYAIGLGDDPYELQGHLDGQTYDDIYVYDLSTGARKLAVQKARWQDEPAPDGIHFAFFRGGNYWVYDMAAGTRVNLTARAPVSFVNTEDDHNLDRPPVPIVGWSRDSRELLLSDNWDVWKVPVSGGTAINLTADGKRDGIRYRRLVNFDAMADPNLRGFDLSKPVYLDAYSEWTKKDGIAVLEPGQPGAHRIQFEDASFAGLEKAKNAPLYIYARQTAGDPPEFYAAGAALAEAAKLTDFAAEVKAFAWSSGTILVNYVGYKGDRLQGALHLPPDYVKGKQYPMVVEFYEKMSQNAFQFQRPTANGFSIGLYTSNGYAVFDPDITYKVNEPGVSAAICLENAVKAAISTGVPDPKRIGIHGHSWGGYQTAFTITQTNLFAAAAAGAPLTDMISMYGLIYKNSGETNGQIFEASQGRFTGPPWDLWDIYTRNSPVANVKNVTTPLLMLSDLGDGAVDFTQGMEYFNALRRLHRPVVLLDYPSQNHSLAKRADQKDYTIRMMQFFDHYLKGGPMPAWYAKGVPALQMADYLKAFNKKTEPAPAAAADGSGGAGHGK